MRIPFVTICVAIAAFRAGVGSYAAPSRSIPKPLRSLLSVPTKRHLRSDKLTPDDEERVSHFDFDLNKLPPEEEIVGKIRESLRTETEHLKLLKEPEQLVEAAASKVDKKTKQYELLNDWNQYNLALKDQLKKASDKELQRMLNIKNNKLGRPIKEKKENLDELLKDWKVPDESIESESKSSTERLQAWLEKKERAKNIESAKKAKLGYELFKVLGIHKAVDKSANSLLISMNVERWNFVMQSLHPPNKYNFETELLDTLKDYCKDDNRARLFMDHLINLRRETNRKHLDWLHKNLNPRYVFKLMKGDGRHFDKMKAWRPYLEAYNDLCPDNRIDKFAALELSNARLGAKIFGISRRYPRDDPGPVILLEEALKKWANLDPPLSPARVLIRFGLLPHGKLTNTQIRVVNEYLTYRNVGKQEEITFEKLEGSLTNCDHLKENALEERKTLNDETEIQRIDDYVRYLDRKKLEQEVESRKPKKPSKRKAESPPDDAREGRRRRGD